MQTISLSSKCAIKVSIVNTPECFLIRFFSVQVTIQDGNIGRSWIHLLQQTHWIYSYIWNDVLWKKRLKLEEIPLHIRYKWEGNHTKAGRKGRDTISLYTPPLTPQPTIRRKLKTQSIFLRGEEFVPHIKHTNFLDEHLRDEGCKHLALKTNGSCGYNKLGTNSKLRKVSEGACTDSPTLGPRAEAALETYPNFMW